MARWAIISGSHGAENVACARALLERLRCSGIRIAGILQHKSRNERGDKRYEVIRICDGERAILAVDGVAARGPAEESFCSMAFHNDAFDAARRWVEEDVVGADLLILDGISKLEVSGKGHSATVERALRREDVIVLLSVRASELSYVVERFALVEDDMVAAIELPAGPEAFGAFATAIEQACLPRQPRKAIRGETSPTRSAR